MSRIALPALEELRERFKALCPDFQSFAKPGTGWAQHEKAYKVTAMERVRSVLAEAADDQVLGKDVFKVLKTAAEDGPFVRWQTEDAIGKNGTKQLGEFHEIIGRLVREAAKSSKAAESSEAVVSHLSRAFEDFAKLHAQGATSLTYGEQINILYSALAMVRPEEAAPLKITRINEAWQRLTGEKLFVKGEAEPASDYRRFSKVFTELFKIMRDEWEWQPQDWLDIQGFLWIALDKTVTAPEDTKASPNRSERPERSGLPGTGSGAEPVNLILYGPPGTGKTYESADYAVRLCGETRPKERGELMGKYKQLREEERIEFVTFHQSMSYEDFVEGLRPTTGPDENQEAASTGFRLEAVPGIFRKIAKRAEDRSSESFVLIIDEINRANISRVFGELITLLEPDKRLGQPNELTVRLPYSEDEFGVPSNLHILGTMNTADRSIALLDTALRRRFTFREMMPNPLLLKGAAEKCGIDLPNLLTTINKRIEYLHDREHQVGHAYFMGCTTKSEVDEVMRHKVIPLLAEYFFEDWTRIADVLGDTAERDKVEQEGKPSSGNFLKCSVLEGPQKPEDEDAERRYRWEVRSGEFNYKEFPGE